MRNSGCRFCLRLTGKSLSIASVLQWTRRGVFLHGDLAGHLGQFVSRRVHADPDDRLPRSVSRCPGRDRVAEFCPVAPKQVTFWPSGPIHSGGGEDAVCHFATSPTRVGKAGFTPETLVHLGLTSILRCEFATLPRPMGEKPVDSGRSLPKRGRKYILLDRQPCPKGSTVRYFFAQFGVFLPKEQLWESASAITRIES